MASKANYVFKWARANIAANRWTSLTVCAVVALTAFASLSLFGFVSGYQAGFKQDIDNLGYDLLITAKGCPYEAATLMLKGGVGLQYMPSGVVEELSSDPQISRVFPMLIHPVKGGSAEDGISLIKGVSPGWYDALKLEMREGEWFDENSDSLSGKGVILGQEAAELEQRHPGDPYLLFDPKTKAYEETVVRGVLGRTGTQVDGTILLPVHVVQERYGLAGKLTGVGVQLADIDDAEFSALRDRYNKRAELQVVTLSKVESTLRKATENLGEVVRLLALFLGVLMATVLLNTALLRTIAERPKLASLRITGFPGGFIVAVAILEMLLLTLTGLVIGTVLTWLSRDLTGGILANYLPYVPTGELIALSPGLVLRVFLLSCLAAALASIPPLVWILRPIAPNQLRGSK